MDTLNNELLTIALNASGSPITVTDALQPDNPIIYCNDAFLKLSEYSREEIIGKNCRFLQGEDTDKTTVSELRNGINSIRDTSVTILNFTKSGRAFWNDLQISPVLDEDGNLTHYIGLQNDISERLEKERILLLTEKLEAEIQLSNRESSKVASLNGAYGQFMDDALILISSFVNESTVDIEKLVTKQIGNEPQYKELLSKVSSEKEKLKLSLKKLLENTSIKTKKIIDDDATSYLDVN
jgi:PAS domain S-box-containing protein